MLHSKRIFSAILAALLVSSALVSCSSDPAQTDDSTADTTTAAPTETTADPLADNLPDDLDFENTTFNVYTRLKYFFHGEMFLEEDSGDQLDAARYAAKLSVQDRLNVTLTESYYGLVDYTDNDAPRNLLMSGDNTYDMFNGRHVNMFNYAAEGLAQKITDLPYIDLDAVWWDKDFSSEVTLGTEKYFALGSYNLTTYDSIHMLLFNKSIFDDLNVSKNHLGGKTLYEVVNDGKWTFDLFAATMTDVSSDLDGNGEMTEDDRYAYLTPAKHVMPSLLLASDQYMLKKDSENLLYNNMTGNEEFYNKFTQIIDLMYDGDNWFPTVAGTTDAQETAVYDMFREGQGLYCDSTGGNVSSFRDMEDDFGIIPYPKADEDQENYRARSEYPELFCIPQVNNRLELTGAILEAISAEYYRSVVPAYYEVSLQSKAARDSDSAEMLDIIYANRVFDFGDTIFCSEIRDGKLRHMLVAKNYDLTSTLASIAGTINEKIDTLNDGFRE